MLELWRGQFFFNLYKLSQSLISLPSLAEPVATSMPFLNILQTDDKLVYGVASKKVCCSIAMAAMLSRGDFQRLL